MALEAYFDDPSETIGAYTRETNGTSDTIPGFTAASSGFFGAYYKDASGNVIITYRGTDDLNDWLDSNLDWPSWTGEVPLQVLDAYNFYLAVVAKEGSSANISFTGHTLGGGLAGTVAAMVGAEAEVFAPAPFEGTAL